MTKVQPGLEVLVSSPCRWLSNLRLGLLCNAASTDAKFNHARFLIADRFPGQLKALFSPQHGFFGEKQDNMVESDHMMDPDLNIPIYSLYGKTRIPTKQMFDSIDVLLVDLQDVGTRVYTFIYTVSYCMEAAKKFRKRILILDRPNPIGGTQVEGNCLSPQQASFVGRFPIPMRHGLTIGELSVLFNETFGIGCDLQVIPMNGWNRKMYYQDTGLPWIPPSPNLPTPTSAAVYPGQVLWEATNVSEGRGTTQPFEIFGAPFFDTGLIIEALGGRQLTGAVLRPIAFEPTSNKWQARLCHGFQIHITELYRFKPYVTSLKLLRIIRFLFPQAFQWKSPPYEYEYKRLPIDLILGDSTIRRRIERFDEIEEIEKSWTGQLEDFIKLSQRFYLYK
ncbi:MAG: DUF1343 domain-containing protein [Deltaproteobacteria bacterium]|nr:DUF1343 domain-containing protein [Deltaproteobacteria bacterium]MBW2150079.1 DUF1343 domain-containing protein [Deltaproteobacteria bacterium]